MFPIGLQNNIVEVLNPQILNVQYDFINKILMEIINLIWSLDHWNPKNIQIYWSEKIIIQWVNDCCLTPSEQIFSYIMTSCI